MRWIWWDGDGFRDGIFMNHQNIWWSPHFYVQGFPLANLQGVSTLRFHKCGI